MFSRFFTQPSKAYRNFQLVYLALALNFLIPGISYLVAPRIAIEQFLQIGSMLGGGEYGYNESSLMWRVLAGTNVITLGTMCVMLMADLRRFFPILWPLTFMKGLTALAFLYVFLFVTHYPTFLGIFFLDGISAALFVIFATRAHRDIQDLSDDVLVPTPLGSINKNSFIIP